MSRQQRKDLVGALKMLALTNPRKWGVLIAAATQIEKLEAELDKVRNGK